MKYKLKTLRLRNCARQPPTLHLRIIPIVDLIDFPISKTTTKNVREFICVVKPSCSLHVPLKVYLISCWEGGWCTVFRRRGWSNHYAQTNVCHYVIIKYAISVSVYTHTHIYVPVERLIKCSLPDVPGVVCVTLCVRQRALFANEFRLIQKGHFPFCTAIQT